MSDRSQIPVFLLCGGMGTRLKEETEHRPKPMVPIGNHPILWHIMRTYSHHGFRKFVLCLGYKAAVIKDYFLSYSAMNSDFTVGLKEGAVQVHSVDHEQDWEVTLAFTGEMSMTGSRIWQAAKRYLGNQSYFAASYGDGLTDADLGAEFEAHLAHGKIGTILGVNPPSRFGEMKLDGDQVLEFSEKPEFTDTWINGGYMFFKREFLEYLCEDSNCILERDPLFNLAEDGEMRVFKHSGYWACMDTQRDYTELNALWDSGKAPWLPRQ